MLVHLATPRAAAVERFFKTTSTQDLLGTYAWCQAVSAGLLPILGDLEIALRNALHRALSQHHGKVDSFGWMLARPGTVATPQKPAPTPHKLGTQTRKDLASLKERLSRQGKSVSPDDIVAALPFGFWEQMIKSLDHSSQPATLQKAILSRVFPCAPDTASTPYESKAFKDRVVRLLTRIRDVRNRIGHHDSIWACPEFDEQGNTGFYPRRPRHTIHSLRLLAERVAWLTGWIDADITSHIHNSDHWSYLNILLSKEALAIYRHTGGKRGTTALVLQRHAELHSRPSKHPKERKPRLLRGISHRAYF